MVLAACALGLGQSVVKLPLPVREEISKVKYLAFYFIDPKPCL